MLINRGGQVILFVRHRSIPKQANENNLDRQKQEGFEAKYGHGLELKIDEIGRAARAKDEDRPKDQCVAGKPEYHRDFEQGQGVQLTARAPFNDNEEQ